jgi:hypothetical protein
MSGGILIEAPDERCPRTHSSFLPPLGEPRTLYSSRKNERLLTLKNPNWEPNAASRPRRHRPPTGSFSGDLWVFLGTKMLHSEAAPSEASRFLLTDGSTGDSAYVSSPGSVPCGTCLEATEEMTEDKGIPPEAGIPSFPTEDGGVGVSPLLLAPLLAELHSNYTIYDKRKNKEAGSTNFTSPQYDIPISHTYHLQRFSHI